MDFLSTLIEKVYQHNIQIVGEENQPILMFFDKPLRMMAAATRIQCAFRLYSWKKKQQKTPLTRIMERRGAVCMQRGWRKWVLQHRLNGLINIKRV